INQVNADQQIAIEQNTVNIVATNDRITTETTRLDQVDASLQQQILDNDSDISVNFERLDIKDISQDDLIAKNTTSITNVSNNLTEQVTRLDKVNVNLQEQITSNNSTINNKVDTAITEINKTDAAQDVLIAENTKEIITVKTDVDRLDTDKADIEYVDIENAKQDAAMNTVVTQNTSSITERVVTVFDEQTFVDGMQNQRLEAHEQAISELNGKADRLDEDVSGGIASAAALAFMPSPVPGRRMISGGAATYNGETSVAVGFTSTTRTGKYTYKLGVTASTAGESVFGGGVTTSFY
ncbi:YadA C-terminal domain-containing protein, partial [uncultured Psychrobacter sp.]|uniref:YadA C-terminal domain-containing protein n=1 Tax=uncultured Psychrobacter sp. TaxID=259303 RepID=UPI0030D87977